jgi:hypothetical protein
VVPIEEEEEYLLFATTTTVAQTSHNVTLQVWVVKVNM